MDKDKALNPRLSSIFFFGIPFKRNSPRKSFERALVIIPAGEWRLAFQIAGYGYRFIIYYYCAGVNAWIICFPCAAEFCVENISVGRQGLPFTGGRENGGQEEDAESEGFGGLHWGIIL